MTGPAGTGHEAVPQRGTAYSVEGSNTGLPADLLSPFDYPVEALCRCGEMIRCEQWLSIGGRGEWVHTGRKPGDPVKVTT